MSFENVQSVRKVSNGIIVFYRTDNPFMPTADIVGRGEEKAFIETYREWLRKKDDPEDRIITNYDEFDEEGRYSIKRRYQMILDSMTPEERKNDGWEYDTEGL